MSRSLLLIVLVAITSLALPACFESTTAPTANAYQGSKGWIIGIEKAKEHFQAGALFLDTREAEHWAVDHLNGAPRADWLSFAESDDPERGLILKEEATLTERLQSLGVSTGRPVVVYGDSLSGWGEDGRIVWLLRTLGHESVYLLDGGYLALSNSSLPRDSTAVVAGKGDFIINEKSDWLITMEELQDIVEKKSGQTIIIDTRERREYDGETPYGETRGGHIPGALHLHYEELLNSYGELKSNEAIDAALTSLGIKKDSDVVVYCTGGVRSAWLAVLLADWGITRARNYAGSMWEWSAGSAETYPLEF
jgi:thiosulfate/3-mercaptopyruvate sulfurtransferase